MEVPTAPHSALSSLFASLHDTSSIEARMDASLTDVVDAVMGSMHAASQRNKPSMQGLLHGFPQADRRESVAWIVQAFDVMGFTDSAIFQATLLLDRYYARRTPGPISAADAQQKLLAVVCLALKVGSRDEAQVPLQQLVGHLGRGKVRYSAVVGAEVEMLGKLKFSIGTPTAHDFLETLSTRLMHHDQLCASLAEYLLQLTLIDPVLHYGYPHAVLAAAALALALTTLKAPAAAFTPLFEDLALHCPVAEVGADMTTPCCQDIYQLWVQSKITPCSFAQHLCAKFSHARYHAVASITPPLRAPSVLPPMQTAYAADPRIGGA
mmetsp:Transcript_39012/g.98070  ORF Transcript_39012/g.98070 Transcript_39012/m.98070 type:complete len:323 (-) Transcript_39012:389-1357(-)